MSVTFHPAIRWNSKADDTPLDRKPIRNEMSQYMLDRTKILFIHRNVIQHLEKGGAVLIFPRGSIEPDPEFMPKPDAEFDRWPRSLEIILHRVPSTQVLVTIVGDVISQACMQHPITWFRRAWPDRQRLAFMYQIIRQVLAGRELFGLYPRVNFGEILRSANYRNVLAEIQASACRTLHHFFNGSNAHYVNRTSLSRERRIT
jgi:hypothetical protein